MPELPEVETIVRTLRPQVEGRRLVGLEVLYPKTLQFGADRISALAGATVRAVRRRAKLLLLDAESVNRNLFTLVFHLKMTGRFFVHPPATAPLKHTRLIFDLAAPEGAFAGTPEVEGRLFFDDMRTFGYCRIMRPDELPGWDFWKSLGPEPLETAPEVLAERFIGLRKGIKAALLDQTVVAGAGNIYADESLFAARLHPARLCRDIPLKDLTTLVRELQAVLRLSIEECGSSIRDYRDADGNAGAFQNNFAVYGKGGTPCAQCARPLENARIAGRGTVFCPYCQK